LSPSIPPAVGRCAFRFRSRSYIQIARLEPLFNDDEATMRKVSNLIVLFAVVVAAIVWLRMQG
jgi:hypothetical protein